MLNSPICWVGGKNYLRHRILPRFPQHHCYVEVFGGAGWMLFGKDQAASKVEIYNDLEGELVNLFRVIKTKPKLFLQAFELELVSREIFNCKKKADPTALTDVGRAARFYYLVKSAFGGRITGKPAFSCGPSRPSNLNLHTLKDAILPIHERLQRVTIENLDFQALLNRYDRPETLFYADPPYWQVTCDYTIPFNWEDQLRLAETLRGIKGRAIVSLNDHPDIRKLYRKFRIETIEAVYRLPKVRRVKELLIFNYRERN